MPSKRDQVAASPLHLTVLGMLAGGPLHPYAIQRLMRAWGKDKVVDVSRRATVYKAIERLRDAGLIAVHKTERDQRFPERTLYQLTDEGTRVGKEWLATMLATPRNEFPEFPAALSFVFGLLPDKALAALEARAARLAEMVAEHRRELDDRSGPPRLFLLETEYVHTVLRAELRWVRGVAEELRSGKLTWGDPQEFTALTQQFTPPDLEA